MEPSTLMTAHIHFIGEQISLIHIPLAHYADYLQPLLKLLSQHNADDASGADPSVFNNVNNVSWAKMHPFLNISITPIECSVVCSKDLVEEFFAPVVARRNQGLQGDIATISSEEFVVISVEGAGLEAGQRVLDLTSPLAMAGISIFFITTYFSDYILVPSKSHTQVIHALEDRGFQFDKTSSAYINVSSSPHHHRSPSATSASAKLPATPPPTTLPELQSRTLSLLNRLGIIPQVHRSLHLVQCAAASGGEPSSPQDLQLQIGLYKSLVTPPRFLSLTLTETDPASLLLEKAALRNFSSEGVLLGNKGQCLIPITLDLGKLPFDRAGIVCGVAGKLVGGTRGGGEEGEPVEMSYLSTARAGTVMVEQRDLERAVEALRGGEEGLDIV